MAFCLLLPHTWQAFFLIIYYHHDNIIAFFLYIFLLPLFLRQVIPWYIFACFLTYLVPSLKLLYQALKDDSFVQKSNCFWHFYLFVSFSQSYGQNYHYYKFLTFSHVEIPACHNPFGYFSLRLRKRLWQSDSRNCQKVNSLQMTTICQTQ